MFNEYTIHMENLSLSSFIALVKNAQRNNDFVPKHKRDHFVKKNAIINSIHGANLG